MKSILFVLDGGFDGGGAERVATRLINGWIESGVEVTVLSLSNSRKESYEISDQVKRIYLNEIKASSNFFSKALRHISNLIQLRNAILNTQSDVVLSFLTRTNIRTILSSLGLGRRVVISERTDPNRQQCKWIWKALRYMLYRYADVVTANTQISIEYMRNFVPSVKLVYIHNPVLLPNKQAQPSISRSILNVGRLVPLKCQVLILEALATIEFNDWTLNILGNGPEEKHLVMNATRLDMEDVLVLHGFVTQTTDFYLNAGIFVLPSLFEGMPNALLEAMSYGLPCIVSDSLVGALEHIDHGVSGLVFRACDVNDLAEKILMLMSNPDLRNALGSVARERVSQYSCERVISDWNAILFKDM